LVRAAMISAGEGIITIARDTVGDGDVHSAQMSPAARLSAC
jgi:hypothetical protein